MLTFILLSNVHAFVLAVGRLVGTYLVLFSSHVFALPLLHGNSLSAIIAIPRSVSNVNQRPMRNCVVVVASYLNMSQRQTVLRTDSLHTIMFSCLSVFFRYNRFFFFFFTFSTLESPVPLVCHMLGTYIQLFYWLAPTPLWCHDISS